VLHSGNVETSGGRCLSGIQNRSGQRQQYSTTCARGSVDMQEETLSLKLIKLRGPGFKQHNSKLRHG
jgi:hypothetical protein